MDEDSLSYGRTCRTGSGGRESLEAALAAKVTADFDTRWTNGLASSINKNDLVTTIYMKGASINPIVWAYWGRIRGT